MKKYYSSPEKQQLKTEYIFIYFEKIEDKPKTSVWECRNNKSHGVLGIIKWYSGWRQYCYFPSCQAVYSGGCLRDIEDFLKRLKKYEKANA